MLKINNCEVLVKKTLLLPIHNYAANGKNSIN